MLVWSDEIYRIFGVEPAQFETTYESFMAFVHPDDRSKVQAAVDAALNGSPYGVEHRIIRSDGLERTVHEIGEMQFDRSGKVRRMIGSVQDVTEQRQLEHRLSHAGKMEALGTLIGGIAHDFNTKMGAITGNVYLAKKDAASHTELHRKLDIIEKLSFDMADKIKQLITFTQRESYEKELLDLNITIRETVDTYPLLEKIAFHVDLSDEKLPVIAASLQIGQALTKVFDNAVDAVANSVHPQIQVASSKLKPDSHFFSNHPDLSSETYAHIEIRDNGEGITPENLEHIFEPFFTTRNAIKGQGLGLSIAYGIVQHHGGAIEINSSLGLGTSVHIYLPLNVSLKPASD